MTLEVTQAGAGGLVFNADAAGDTSWPFRLRGSGGSDVPLRLAALRSETAGAAAVVLDQRPVADFGNDWIESASGGDLALDLADAAEDGIVEMSVGNVWLRARVPTLPAGTMEVAIVWPYNVAVEWGELPASAATGDYQGYAGWGASPSITQTEFDSATAFSTPATGPNAGRVVMPSRRQDGWFFLAFHGRVPSSIRLGDAASFNSLPDMTRWAHPFTRSGEVLEHLLFVAPHDVAHRADIVGTGSYPVFLA